MEQELAARLDAARALWSLTDPVSIADTATSCVYRARLGDTWVALKLLKPHGADEIGGVGLMQWWAGDGAARIIGVDRLAILMEWLDGPSLGDMVRDGRDTEGTAILCDIAARLHQPRGPLPDGLDPLPRRFKPLLDGDPTIWPASHRPLAARAAALALMLLETTTEVAPLHGDLHHDNVMNSARGWLAIDAKGVLGDRHYDLANVFRNPYGAGDLARQPVRIDALADAFAARLGLDRLRVLQWAAAHSALSACWDHEAGTSDGWDLTMLPRLLEAVDRAR